MAEIIKFPTTQARGWTEFKRGVKALAIDSGMSTEAENELLARMKPFFDLLEFEFNVSIPPGTPCSLKRECEAFAVNFKEFTHRLLVDRFNVEVDRLRIMGLL